MRRNYTETERIAQLFVADEGYVTGEPSEIGEFAAAGYEFGFALASLQGLVDMPILRS